MDRKLHRHQEPQVLPGLHVLGRAHWPLLLCLFSCPLLRHFAFQASALDQFLGPRHLPHPVLLSHEAHSAQLQQPRGALFEILEPLRCLTHGLPEHFSVVHEKRGADSRTPLLEVVFPS
jgi:hypothetical protein